VQDQTGQAQIQGGGGSSGGGGVRITYGGVYGGGSSGAVGTVGSSIGGVGCVRIIFGPSRAFPSTNTGDL
jgi:hypothetical protein